MTTPEVAAVTQCCTDSYFSTEPIPLKVTIRLNHQNNQYSIMLLTGTKPKSPPYLVSTVALLQQLLSVASLLLQFLNSKLKLVTPLSGLVALLGVRPCHRATGTLPIPKTLFILRRPVACKAEIERNQ